MSRIDSFIHFLITTLEGYSENKPCNHNKGETHRTCYGFYEKYHTVPKSMQEAVDLYKKDWLIFLTGVEDLDLFILQFSVNIGETRALKLVRKLKAQKAQDLEVITLEDLVKLQLDYYKSLPAKFNEFQKGWANRVNRTVEWLNKA